MSFAVEMQRTQFKLPLVRFSYDVRYVSTSLPILLPTAASLHVGTEQRRRLLPYTLPYRISGIGTTNIAN